MNKGRLKKTLTHIGLHLHRHRILPDPRDIFGLTVDQAEGVVREYEQNGIEAAAQLAAELLGASGAGPLPQPAKPPSLSEANSPESEGSIEEPPDPPPAPSRALEALGLCGMCLRRVAVRHRHHVILRRSEGGPDEEWNLMPLCPECHSFVHSHPLVDAVAVWLKMRETPPPELEFVPERVLKAQELPEFLRRALMGEDVRIPLEEQAEWPPFLNRLIRMRSVRIRIGLGPQ